MTSAVAQGVARTCNPTGGVCETTADTYNAHTDAYYQCVCNTDGLYDVDEIDTWCYAYTERTTAPSAGANCDRGALSTLLSMCALLISRMLVCV
jgi:hypothetical protein